MVTAIYGPEGSSGNNATLMLSSTSQDAKASGGRGNRKEEKR
jgi:hypothetical protein